MLARATWDEAGAKLFVEAVTRAAQDAEWKDRVRAIEDSYVRLGAGGNLQGLPSLKEQVGEQVATCVAEWLEIGGDHAQQSNLPTIRIKEGEIERIVDEMEEALIAQERGVYQRNAELVTIGEAKIVTASSGEVPAMRIFELPESAVAEHVCASANFLKFDARSKRDVVSDPPRKYITTLFERGPKLRVPVLAGISFVPILRRDGSIASSPGYDAITGLFFDPRGATFPEVAQHPSKDDAQGALDALNELIAECPFVADGDRAVAVSGILTAVIRRGLTAAPLHAFSSPVAGSGKSFLVDIAAAIATGREASVIAQGPNEEETEKRLGAVLRYGDPLISIDNCEKPLGGECLCQIATQPYVRARILGLSEMPELPGRTMLFATGNNLTVFGDMSRRTIMCSLDPKRERPELRHFARNPITMVKADRGRYVHASLTILRAYRLDEDAERPPALGSFEDWSSTVRGALMWLGMADPVATMEEVRTSDTKLEELALVLMNWEKVLGTKRTSVAEIIKTATEQHLGDFVYGDFRDALLAVAGTGSTINAKRLGRWIAKNKERLVEDRRICRDADFDKVAHWRLERREGV